MAAPQPLPCDDIARLAKEQLFVYFTQNSRYSEDAPSDPYCIRFGSRHVFSNDTNDLFNKFYERVKAHRRAHKLKVDHSIIIPEHENEEEDE